MQNVLSVQAVLPLLSIDLLSVYDQAGDIASSNHINSPHVMSEHEEKRKR